MSILFDFKKDMENDMPVYDKKSYYKKRDTYKQSTIVILVIGCLIISIVCILLHNCCMESLK